MKKHQIILGSLSIPLLLLVSNSASAMASRTLLSSKPPFSLSVEEPNKSGDLENQVVNESTLLSQALSFNKGLAGELDPSYVPTNAIPGSSVPIVHNNKPFPRVNDDMIVTDGQSIAANTSTLNNTRDVPQTMLTPAFRYSQEDKVTTTTSNSVGTGVTASATMEFPCVSGSLEMSVNYDFSSTQSVESTTTKEWTVPSQTVEVPAHSSVKVTWLLNKATATGTTDLTNQVTADIPYEVNSQGERKTSSIGQAIKDQARLYNEFPIGIALPWNSAADWEVIDNSTALRHWSDSTYEAELGTDMVMTTSDVTTGKVVLLSKKATNATFKIIK